MVTRGVLSTATLHFVSISAQHSLWYCMQLYSSSLPFDCSRGRQNVFIVIYFYNLMARLLVSFARVIFLTLRALYEKRIDSDECCIFTSIIFN